MSASNQAGLRREGLAYAGDIAPREAWDRLQREPNAVLIDVRTAPEWAFSGEADLSQLGRKPVGISWKTYPTYALNPDFLATFRALNLPRETPVFFLCKTGGRSLDAACAVASEGYSQCYNVADGFEGPQDADGKRGVVAGWKASGLPWRQA